MYIIVLNWNGWQDTIECIESCLRLRYPHVRIVLVDNGSGDGSESILRGKFPHIELIQTGENLGFAGGNNTGIQYALEQGADYIWLLNNDTIVDPEALTELVALAASDEKTGIVGSKIYYFAEPRKIWFAGGFWLKSKSYAYHRGLDRDDSGQYDEICEVDYITGCSLLIKSAAVREIGLMDEDYFLYWEEVDWNARAMEHGWKILYAPRSLVWHKISASFNNQSYLQNRYNIRNCLIFFQRHALRRMPQLLVYIVCDAMKLWCRGQRGSAKGYLHGLKDFALRRTGQIH